MNIRKKRPEPRSPIRNIPVIIAAFLIAAVLSGLSRQSLVLTVYRIVSSEVPEAFDGYKIAHISDFHSGLSGSSAADVVAMTKSQSPDIICLTGDIVDGKTRDLVPVEALIAGLVKIAPVYAVTGNNERYGAKLLAATKELYAEYGVIFMDGEKVTISAGESILTILGIADPGGSGSKDDRGAARGADTHGGAGFGIILYHRSNEFGELAGSGYHLVLSGHLHGGLIRLPFAGGILSPYNELFPEYSGGLYKRGDMYLISNRGTGNNSPIPRVYNPPEVVIIVLHAG